MPQSDENDRTSQFQIESLAGIYVHIPFCRQACSYCNFHFSTALTMRDEMVIAIKKEIALQKDFLSEAIETIYFGGGTPSLLFSSAINGILETITQYFDVSRLKEVTLEANPDDLSDQYLSSLKGTLVNRLSIGVQSFHDSDLRYMNRTHDANEAYTAIKRAQDQGFLALSIDLIYGTPGLTDDLWQKNLDIMSSLAVPHISAYALTVEEKTALYYKIKKETSPPVDEEQSARQMSQMMKWADNSGYEHYEISNYALPEQYAVHNTNYWRGRPYLGIGPSAHSFDGHCVRRWNVSNNSLYMASISNGIVPFEQETLTSRQRLNEHIMISLRSMWGMDIAHVRKMFDEDSVLSILENAQKINKAHIIITNERIVLTNRGKMYADSIASEIFSV